jgi:hypothetical protein
MEQNYFQVDQEYYKQTDRLAISAPTTSILADTYIQYTEHKQVYLILITQKIIAYFRYVDDILMVDDPRKTNIEHTFDEFNKLHAIHKIHYRKRTA